MIKYGHCDTRQEPEFNLHTLYYKEILTLSYKEKYKILWHFPYVNSIIAEVVSGTVLHYMRPRTGGKHRCAHPLLFRKGQQKQVHRRRLGVLPSVLLCFYGFGKC